MKTFPRISMPVVMLMMLALLTSACEAQTPSDAANEAAAPATAPTTAEAVRQIPGQSAHPGSFAELAERLLPSVVNISTTQIINRDDLGSPFPDMPQFPQGSPFEEFFRDFMEKHDAPQGAPRRATSLGSGFVVDAKEGLIATNNHVIEDADEINVTLHDNTTIKAEIVGRDSKTDLALLKIKTDRPLTATAWGDSDTMRVGDWILAIGNPFGLGGTVTSGIISARARDINAGPYDDFIQTDASINRGNSGGPMFDLEGRVIGINTAIFSPSGGSVGIGFAIPANMAKNVLEQLKASGKITRGWIGVRIQQVTDDIAKSLGLPKTYGALVSTITPKSPAESASLKTGDIITDFNGREVSEMRRLPRMVAETPVGTKVTLGIWRDGKPKSVSLTIAELPADMQDEDKEAPAEEPADKTTSENVEALGMKVTALTAGLRQKFELDEKATGLLVVEVDPAGTAAEKSLQPGDLILEAGQHKTDKPAALLDAVKEAKSSDKPLLLLVERAGDARFVAVPVK